LITIIIHSDGPKHNSIELVSETDYPEHVVVIDARENWTDSPETFTKMSESEQAELIAEYRNFGYEDRNP
jgi:hypothetical protein